MGQILSVPIAMVEDAFKRRRADFLDGGLWSDSRPAAQRRNELLQHALLVEHLVDQLRAQVAALENVATTQVSLETELAAQGIVRLRRELDRYADAVVRTCQGIRTVVG